MAVPGCGPLAEWTALSEGATAVCRPTLDSSAIGPSVDCRRPSVRTLVQRSPLCRTTPRWRWPI
uniref:Ketoacyl_synth_N domain-containing protein n=1 Tax=Macrostomum lignano TaxID=282301 RepID=A0A1I8HNX6_9PLAT